MSRDAHIQIRTVAHGSEIFRRVVMLREDVLRKPLGLAYRAEDLAAEHDQFHLAAFAGETPVASVILQWLPDRLAKMRQMAVDPAHQRSGLGGKLVMELEGEARRRDIHRIVLHARESALGFYLRLGYAVRDEPFTEVGLPHRRMEKVLVGTSPAGE
jgi:ribosomal protein S18 acetylase RimI-like enzyme